MYIIHATNYGIELLGSPIGSNKFMHMLVEEKVENISKAAFHLEAMDDVDIELTLLHGSLGYSKVVDLLGTCPLPDILDALVRYDGHLHSKVEGILHALKCGNEHPYMEASIPPGMIQRHWDH